MHLGLDGLLNLLLFLQKPISGQGKSIYIQSKGLLGLKLRSLETSIFLQSFIHLYHSCVCL